jgi:hypothetical protein
MCPRTDAFPLPERIQPSSVTSTSSSGKMPKNAQKAIIVARLEDLSSEYFSKVASAMLSRRWPFCASSSLSVSFT